MENFEYPRDFKGVFIPKNVWLDKRLTPIDKLILIEIDSLDTENGHCYASNEYIAEFCQCSVSKVSKSISKLKKFGYLKIVKTDGRKRWISTDLSPKSTCLAENDSLPSKKCQSDEQKMTESNIESNIEYNNSKYTKSFFNFSLDENEVEEKENPSPKKAKSFSCENTGDLRTDALIRRAVSDLRAHRQSDESISLELLHAYTEYCNKYHREINYNDFDLIAKNILYFVHQYKEFTGHYHNIYQSYAYENMKRIIDVFVTNMIDENAIDTYFNDSNFSEDCDYRLAHFLSKTIIDILEIQTYGTK